MQRLALCVGCVVVSAGLVFAADSPPSKSDQAASGSDPWVRGIAPTAPDGTALNLEFESGDLRDWITTGEAFARQPVEGDAVHRRRKDMHSRHRGKYWVGTFEVGGDRPQGTLSSSTIKVTHPYAAFLVGGGAHETTCVELVWKDSGKTFLKVSGRNREDMEPVVVDLRLHVGKEIFIRLVDRHSGGWGHINFDEFRFFEEKPVFEELIAVEATPVNAHAGLTAQEAAAAMTLPEGFRATVFAAEPDVQQPIAFALDDRGRLWVAEGFAYPFKRPAEEARDRILIFDDTDGDGQFDTRKVFIDKLNLVSGLEVGHGGVWVGQAPELLFIPDRNGDDVPDSDPVTLLDGWGYHDTHETLNAFVWGPDGWLYGCHGVFTHSKVGKPGTADNERVPLNAGIWRYHPTRHEFEVFAHGTSNPWGVDFNDRGQAFLTSCVIPHLFHVIHGGRYHRQAGQHFNRHTYDDIKTIADHLHYTGSIRDHAHWGHTPQLPSSVAAAGGGHAHAGAMIYLGDRWPEQYRDRIFMNNIHGARVNMDVLEPSGSGYVGHHGPDLLVANDEWSQILNFRYGPDGNVYFIDWYDQNECHHRDAEKHDRSNGRIYKISYGDDRPVRIDLRQKSNEELVALQEHANDWYVRHARRLLYERFAAGQIAAESHVRQRLAELAFTHADETRRLRGLWALHVTGGLTEAHVQQGLANESPYVRAWTIQLALDGHEPSRATLSQLATLAHDDPSPVVRLYLASAAQRLPLDQRWDILAGLVSHAEDADDHNLPLMTWYALEPLAAEDPRRALALAESSAIPLVQSHTLRRIGDIGSEDAVALLVETLGRVEDPADQLTYLGSIREALQGKRSFPMPGPWKTVSQKLAGSRDAKVRNQALALGVTFGDEQALAHTRDLLVDSSADVEQRKSALQALLGARDPELAPVLQRLIQEQTLRREALRGLAAYADPQTPPAILDVYASLSPAEKRDALGTLASRPAFATALLDAIEKKQIAPADLSADVIRQLRNLNDENILKRINEVWGVVRETAEDKKKLIAQYERLIKRNGRQPDLSLGRAVFAKTCAQCHKLFDAGGAIGPDLTGSNRRNLDYVLSNVIDPSAVMAKEYQPSILVTVEGRTITGLVKETTTDALTVATANETVIVPRGEIEFTKQSDKSMMPDDLWKQLTPHEVRSLVAYLGSSAQVPVLATSETVKTFYNGVDLSGWSGNPELWKVENGEIVGQSSGLKRNEFLISDLAVENFELTLQVKLVPNKENSGIQFRSEPLADGGVKGYQADIGAGWWGKLYEEHGRTLLWKKSGEEFVKPGKWNEYRIVAVGDRIRTYLNGHLCVDLHDPQGAKRGIIAFQLHSGGPMEVRFKNLQLSLNPTLDARPQASAKPGGFHLHDFERVQLTDVYYSEGANFGDFNRDGVQDIVYGPYWFEGPDYETKREIYPAKPQPTERYADNFFSWVDDFNGDGWNDVFVVGFPGTPAYVYENPTDKDFDKPWPKHQVFDWVSNESPHFTNLTGDDRPELVCTRDGHFGYAVPDWNKPFKTWSFHAVSGKVATPRFGHGLGVGDVNGDGLLDILTKDGWFQQPDDAVGDPPWPFYKAQFAPAGGAEMYAYDVDGDGDNDVITSLAAHAFGLAWYEQIREGDAISFRKHLIMGDRPGQNRYGVVFSELHSVALADVDGDGLKDIVTGKTYWSHHRQAPMWDAGAVVYWFRLVRTPDGVDWVPHQADDDSGIGRQVIVGDVTGNGLPDIVAGGMKGGHLLRHRRTKVDEARWQAAQPRPAAE